MDAVQWLSRRWVAIALDVLVVFGVYFGALFLRFDGTIPEIYGSRFIAYAPFIGGTYVMVGFLTHAYRAEAPRSQVGAAALASGSLVIAVGFLLGRPVPTSVLILGTLGVAASFIGLRALGRAAR